jgi:phytoene dehydrogenase-like protein
VPARADGTARRLGADGRAGLSITIAGRRCIPSSSAAPAWTELGPDLSRHGLEYITAPLAMASSLPDGRAAVAPVDPEAFVEELERLGETAGWNALFAAVGPIFRHF